MSPMPPDAGSAADWLRYAHADLALARGPLPAGAMYASLCFHAQQAAEKSLKAVLVHHGKDVPRTHSIERLLELLAEFVAVPSVVEEAVELSAFAVMARYPGDYEEIERETWVRAVWQAALTYDWACKQVG